MEREWKLGEDLSVQDCIFDPITFEELITTIHCNIRKDEIGPYSICEQLGEIIKLRMTDAFDLLKINAEEIMRLAKGE